MKKPGDDKKSESELTSDQRLEIRDEVERRLLNLPGETLKFIQNEIDERVAKTEKKYFVIFTIIAVLGGIIVNSIYKTTWENLDQKLATFISSTEVEKKTKQIEQYNEISSELSSEISNTWFYVQENGSTFSNRLNELQTPDYLAKQENDLKFLYVALGATHDDRVALDQLRLYVQNTNDSHFEVAKKVFAFVVDSRPFLPDTTTAEREKLHLDKLSLDQIEQVYRTNIVSRRIFILSYIWNDGNFSKAQKLRFIADKLKNEKSICVTWLSAGILNSEAKLVSQDDVPGSYDFGNFLDWWNENQNKYQ